MKLYTEKQVRRMIDLARFTYNSEDKILLSQIPQELPTWDDVKLAIELANKNINRLSMKWTKEDIIREIKKSKTK